MMLRHSIPLAAFALATTLCGVASAQRWSSSTDLAQEPNRNPDARVEVELRMGAYHPNVDEGVGKDSTGSGPYQRIFGDSKRYMIGGEVDWQPLHIPHFASLGIGGSIGYTSATGAAIRTDNGEPSAEDATLTIWPFAALAVLRVDVIAREMGIPIVPFVKVGPAVAFWSSSNGRGTSRSRVDGTLGRGHTFGMVYSVGGMLLLNFLDRQAAKTFAVEQGVLRTYILIDYTITDLRGLGQSNAMHLGDKTWNLGFAFEL